MRLGYVHRYSFILLTFGYVDWWMGCECDWSMVFQLALNYLALSWFQSRINYMKSRQTIYSWFWRTSNCVKSHMISSLLFSLFIRVFIGHEIGVCAPTWSNLAYFWVCRCVDVNIFPFYSMATNVLDIESAMWNHDSTTIIKTTTTTTTTTTTIYTRGMRVHRAYVCVYVCMYLCAYH